MTNELVTVHSASPALYDRMQHAIAECYSIDDCKNMATEAAAIAAYYKQIKDDESVRKFLQVKIRAWRRIGEILASANIDKATCYTPHKGRGANVFNFSEYVRRIRVAFEGRTEVEQLSDQGIRQALKIAELPSEFFDKNVGKHASIDSLLDSFAALQRKEWEMSPEGQAKLKELNELQEIRKQQEIIQQQEELQRKEKESAILQECLNQRAKEDADLKILKAERDKAFDEVGITLERRDREQMQQIVFLLKKSIHEILRQAAFDNHTTMQSILRSGLMMWFIAHGYNVPTDDMKLPQRKRL